MTEAGVVWSLGGDGKGMTTRVNVGVRDKGKDGIGEEAVYWARNYYLLWVA